MTPEMVKRMRDMMTKKEETVESKTLCEYGGSCADTKGGETDANTTGPSTDHSHEPAVQFVDGHASLMSSGGAKLGCPNVWRRIQECVWIVL